MWGWLSYLSEWKQLVRRGIYSYRETTQRLEDAREYHRRRSVNDDDYYTPGYRIEVPILWGSF